MISPETLRRFALFAGLEPAAFKDIAMISEEVQCEEGCWIFRESDDADALYIIQSGQVDLRFILDEAGEKLIDITKLGEGSVIGWSSLVEPCAYTLSAMAASDVTLVKIDAVALSEMMEADKNLGYNLMKQLAQALGERLTNLRVQFVSFID
ncbi:MAG: cyclic nucleotide-binding domain-containing protein [Anaerolineae bacterium]|nr:cyclic nucleotide-binding domain-containing protein [Anaerolineae bacterium]